MLRPVKDKLRILVVEETSLHKCLHPDRETNGRLVEKVVSEAFAVCNGFGTICHVTLGGTSVGNAVLATLADSFHVASGPSTSRTASSTDTVGKLVSRTETGYLYSSSSLSHKSSPHKSLS
ncbi:MAG: hypothetical protein AAB719_00550 [Patescibacteria group bacterium]